RENNFRLLRRIKWKIEGFWPTESRENPRGGKLAFPLGLFPGFPRMLYIRVGGFQPPGQKHNGVK
ncbi:MAG: hypothetical protein IJP78_09735, partial [Clostridia bacterium]|nr:hypothetical protein [Clostridia bacterium]